MKIMEIVQKSTNTVYDLSLNARFAPKKDNTNTIRNGSKRKPVISLKHINRLKKVVAAKKQEFEARKELMGLMYSVGGDEEGGSL